MTTFKLPSKLIFNKGVVKYYSLGW